MALTKVQYKKLWIRLHDQKLHNDFYYGTVDDCNRVTAMPYMSNDIHLKDGRILNKKSFESELDFLLKFKCEINLKDIEDKSIFLN